MNVFRSERGSALILSLLALLVLTVLGLSLVGLGMTEFTISTNWKDYTRTFYAAEAAAEAGVVTLRNQLNLNPTPTQAQLCALNGTTSAGCGAGTQPANLPAFNASAAGTYAFNTFTFNWGVNSYCTAANTPQGCFAAQAPTTPHNYRTSMPTGPYSGMFGITTDFVITASVTGPGGTRSTIGQTYQYIQVPLFQFGVFYGRGVDLEIAPGPPMTFNGRVHANSDIYMGTNSSLKFDSSITTSSTVHRNIKRDTTSYPFGGANTVEVKDAGGTFRPLNFDHDKAVGFTGPQTEAQWTSLVTSTFGGKIKDRTLGVQDIIPPVPSMFYDPAQPDVEAHKLIELPQAGDPANLAAAKMFAQAGLRIDVTGALAPTTGTDANGVSVNLPAGTVSFKTFFDKRENATVTVAEIDMSRLSTRGTTATACNSGSSFGVAGSLAGSLGAKGVLYVADSAKVKSVRLINGDCLPNIAAGGGSGLTVVSQNPVYIQGDFNCPGCAGTQPASAPVGQVSAAVLADAVTILSNNWKANNSDTKGNQSFTNRAASATTVNAALMFGPSNESTPSNGGNGQLENLPRFLEDWAGKAFNYAGSLVALWHSQQPPPGSLPPTVSQWIAPGTYYNAPNRNWKYDTRFNTTQPPGAPSGVIQQKGRWSQG